MSKISIGCYDEDMNRYTQVPFNLELMKISSYFKKRGEIVSLAPIFKPERYGTFYYRKDYEDNYFRKDLFDFKNIKIGGYAFFGQTYIPLDEKIEEQIPDLYLYDRIKEKFIGESTTFNNMYRVLRNSTHLRLSLDGKTVWGNYKKQINPNERIFTLFLHDFNLNQIKDSYLAINDIIKDKKIANRKIPVGNKFPIIVNNDKDLLQWSNLQPSQFFFLLQFNGIMDDGLLVEFVEKTRNKSTPLQLIYLITANSKNQDDFLKNQLSKIFKQICFLRMQGVKISLKYEDNFFIDQEWEKLIDLFNCYLNGFINIKPEIRKKMISKDSLFKFCRSFEDYPIFHKRFPFSKNDARKLFHFVANHDRELFELFYKCSEVELKGGNFVVK